MQLPTTPGPRIGHVRVDGHELQYSDHGAGDRVIVMLHGLLFNRRMDERVAKALAEYGYRVLCIDQLGHGGSDRPVDPGAYSMQQFARYVLAVMDSLKIDEAVVAGRSMGANTALEIALLAPRRLRGLICESPILEGAQLVAMGFFGPFLVAGILAPPLMRAIAAGSARIPRGDNLILDMYLDAVGGDPKAKTALLQGILFDRTAPPPAERATITTPALVVGYPKDPLHRDSEVRTLLSELPNSRYMELSTMYELHTHPQRVFAPILVFLRECWATTESN